MSKKDSKSGGEIRSQDWKDYDEDSKILYSYLKKKGKHKRAKADSINK